MSNDTRSDTSRQVELTEQDLAELSAVPRPMRSPRRIAGSLRRRLSR